METKRTLLTPAVACLTLLLAVSSSLIQTATAQPTDRACAGSLNVTRYAYPASLLPNGRVLVASVHFNSITQPSLAEPTELRSRSLFLQTHNENCRIL